MVVISCYLVTKEDKTLKLPTNNFSFFESGYVAPSFKRHPPKKLHLKNLKYDMCYAKCDCVKVLLHPSK